MRRGALTEKMTQPPLFTQIISTLGALCCLLAYVGHQLKWMDAKKVFYNLLNIVGAGILTYVAFKPFQAGFLLMETVWTAVSIYALFKILRKSVNS